MTSHANDWRLPWQSAKSEGSAESLEFVHACYSKQPVEAVTLEISACRGASQPSWAELEVPVGRANGHSRRLVNRSRGDISVQVGSGGTDGLTGTAPAQPARARCSTCLRGRVMTDPQLGTVLDGVFGARDRQNIALSVAAIMAILAKHSSDLTVPCEAGGAGDSEDQWAQSAG